MLSSKNVVKLSYCPHPTLIESWRFASKLFFKDGRQIKYFNETSTVKILILFEVRLLHYADKIMENFVSFLLGVDKYLKRTLQT